MRAPLHRAIALGVLSFIGIGASACAAHEVEPAFRASVLIDDRGISIPLPPPSLVDEPEQDVEVEGQVVGLDGDLEDLAVRVVDNVGGAELQTPLGGDSRFRLQGLGIDLTDNCIEAWLENTSGEEGAHRHFEAVISEPGPGGEQSLEVVEVSGCG